MQQLYNSLSKLFPIDDLTQQRNDLAFISVNTSHLHAILRYLRDQAGFTHLVLLTAVDWLEKEQFQLTYLLHNRPQAQDIGIRVMIPREPATMESIHDLWPTAATYQRELYEMFGISFPGSPRLSESFILEGWQDLPPYRRDFDTLAYAQKTFRDRPGRETHHPAQHMLNQLKGGDADV